MTTARKFKTTPVRRGLIAKVKIAQKQLGLDDDTYRAKLAGLYGGKTSATQLDIGELEDLVRQLKAEGATFTKRKAPARAGTRKLADGEMQAKMRALWISLYHLGLVRAPAEAALASFAKRITRVAALQWLDPEQANKVIEALKAWATRDANVDWLESENRNSARFRVLEAQWKILMDLGEAYEFFGLHAYAAQVAGTEERNVISNMTEAQQDQVIEALGAKIRKALGARNCATLKDWRGVQKDG